MPRDDKKEGVEVSTGEFIPGEVSIVDVTVISQWTCPNPECGVRWKKRGIHGGVLRSCAACGTRFFLRSDEGNSG
jgi:hypothetical protein